MSSDSNDDTGVLAGLPELEPLTVVSLIDGGMFFESAAEGGQLAQLPPDGLDLKEHMFSIERALIQQALERAGGTVAHAARLLNLRRTTLVEKLRKFDLATPEVVTDL